MAKSLISWVVVGVLTYLWWWIGYDWKFLQELERGVGDWKPVWLLFTILTLIVLRHGGAPESGAGNVAEAVIGRVKNVVPHLLGLTLALLVGDTIFALTHEGGLITSEYLQAVVVAVGSAVTTAAWLGAIEDASR